MSKYVFYAPNPTKNGFLSEEESHHACRVLRVKIGDKIRLLDGKGRLFETSIHEVHVKNTRYSELDLLEKQEKPNYQIHLYVAPTKQMERMEWMVEKCCEFGIHGIGFFMSKNSERKDIKLIRLEKIAIAALKQSKNLFLPEIHGIVTLNKLIESFNKDSTEKFLFANISNPPVAPLSKQIQLNQVYTVLIGPEGDFTSEETQILLNSHGIPFSLGKPILRTETACIASTHAIHLLHEMG